MLESTLASQISIVLFMSLLTAAAMADIAYYKIPNVLVASILALYPGYVLVSPAPVAWLPAVGIALAFLVIGFAMYAWGFFGAGDAKLLAVTLLWADPLMVPLAFVIILLMGGLMAMFLMSPLRFVIAQALNTLRQRNLSDTVLAKDMPYGVAIASGGLFIGCFRLITG